VLATKHPLGSISSGLSSHARRTSGVVAAEVFFTRRRSIVVAI